MASLTTQCLIIGAGAAGLHCAGKLALGGDAGPTRALVIDHAKRPAEKVRISGGGRCNFTNREIDPKRFLSTNPHFCKSALKRYSHWDFISEVATHGIAYHEKTLGQLFCDESAQQIIDMLMDQAQKAGAAVWLNTVVEDIEAIATGGFLVTVRRDGMAMRITTQNLVVACGGLSIPKIGATGLGYRIATQFGHSLIDTRPGLVPLTFSGDLLDHTKALSGVATPTSVSVDRTSFDEGMLFTHRGLSGPSILQISSYWRESTPITVDLAPGQNVATQLMARRQSSPKKQVKSVLAEILPARLAEAVCAEQRLDGTLADTGNKALDALGRRVHQWQILPTGTEGYRTAEVTLGGVDTNQLSSKTMQSAHIKGLYFIGEVVDVTGWLGGYNFQWAWSSAWAAAKAVSAEN